MPHVYLQIKHAALAHEARIIRHKEQKYKKWIQKTISLSEPMSEEAKKGFEGKGWKIKIQSPQQKPLTSEEERSAYRANIWKEKARLRKENKNYNPEIRHSLWNHRVYHVRPEARACHLALGYLKQMPYNKIERSCHNNNIPDNTLIGKILYNIEKFGEIQDPKDPKNTKNLLEAWLRGEPFPSPLIKTEPVSVASS